MVQRNPNMLSQLGLEMGQLQAMVQHYDQQDKLKKLNQESKITKDRSLWKEWLMSYRSVNNVDTLYQIVIFFP